MAASAELLRPYDCPRKHKQGCNPTSSDTSSTATRISRRRQAIVADNHEEAGRELIPSPIGVTEREDVLYAGCAFELSPSPRKLPVPSFTNRRATEGLRRLLRLI